MKKSGSKGGMKTVKFDEKLSFYDGEFESDGSGSVFNAERCVFHLSKCKFSEDSEFDDQDMDYAIESSSGGEYESDEDESGMESGEEYDSDDDESGEEFDSETDDDGH